MDKTGKRFLIIKLSSLGDIVHALPVLRTLRENHADAFIAWMVEERYRDLLAANPDLDEVIVVRTKVWRKNWNLAHLREILETVRRVRRLRFDMVFDLHGLLKSGVIAAVSGTPVRVGFHRNHCKEKINTLFNNRQGSDVLQGTHVVDRYLDLAAVAGGEKRIADSFPLQVSQEHKGRIDSFMNSDPELGSKPIAAINPGAGFESKQWSLERFAELADRISRELGYSILLTWGPGEEDKVKTIADRMSQPHWIAPPTTISESIALYRRLALLVSCDSGPLHLCAALGIPTVSTFGPTDPARNGAYGPNHEVVCHVLPCSFCWKRKCPLQTNECMTQVTVEDVFQAVKTSAAKHVKSMAS